MKTKRSATVLALSLAALATLAGCTGDGEAIPASTQQAVSSASAAKSEEGVPSVGTTRAGAAAGKDTDAELASMLKGVKVGAVPLQPLPAGVMQQMKKVSGNQLAETMEKATVTPETCRAATLENARTAPSGSVPMAGAAAKDAPVVLLRSLATAADAQRVVEAAQRTSDACATYTMDLNASGEKISIKGTTKSLAVESATSQHETGQVSGYTMAGTDSSTTTAIGHVDNILIQITSLSGSVPAAELSKTMEAVAKSVATKR